MSDVFLSYARTHQQFVMRLRAKLEQTGKEGWVDWEGIAPAAEWMVEIEEAIDGADVFAFVITADSVRSEVCKKELERAVAQNKRLIPLLCEDVPYNDIPSSLRARQLLFFRPVDDFDAGFAQLASAIDRDLSHAKAHTRWQLRAAAWQSRGRDPSLLLRDLELEDADRWLAASGDKEPTPTTLQIEFIETCRVALKQSRRVDAERLARARRSAYALQLARVNALPDAEAAEAERLLEEATNTPLDLRDFCWGYLHRRFLGARHYLRGHGGDPMTVCLSHNGALAAAGFHDGTIYVWSHPDAPPKALNPHKSGIRRLIFSEDSHRLASMGGDGIVACHEVESGAIVSQTSVGQFEYLAISFTQRQRLRIVAATGSELWIGMLPSRTPLSRLGTDPAKDGKIVRLESSAGGRYYVVVRDGGSGEVRAHGSHRIAGQFTTNDSLSNLAVSDDGRRVALAHWRSDVVEVLHGSRLGKRESIVMASGIQVGALRFSPDGYTLAIGGGARHSEPLAAVTLYSGPGFRHSIPLDGHLRQPRDAAFSADGRSLVTCGDDGLIVIHDLASRPDTTETAAPTRAVTWSRNGRWMAIGLPAGGVELRDLTNGTTKNWEDPTLFPLALAFSPDATSLAAAVEGYPGIGGRAVVRDLETGQVQLLHDSSAHSLAWSPDSRHLAIGIEGQVLVWDAKTGAKRTMAREKGKVSAVAFSPDGELLVSGHWRNVVLMSEPASGELLGKLEGHSAAIVAIAFTDDGRQLVSISEKDRVLAGPNRYLQRQSPEMIFWDIEARRERTRVNIEDEVGIATAMAASVDGALVATGHDDGTVCFWDPVIAQPRLMIRAHREAVAALAFAHDGRTLASSATKADDGLRLWHADDWRSSALLKGHKGRVNAVVFTPDSRQFVSASGYDGGEVMQPGEILVWDTSTAQSRRLFSEHDNAVYSIVVSPDGNSVAALTRRAVIVFDMATGAVRWRVDVAGVPTAAVSYSQNGNWLFALDQQFNAASGARSPRGIEPEPEPLGLVPEGVTARARTADKAWFAVGTEDGRVLACRLSDALQVEGSLRHVGPVNAVAFSTDGRYLASAGGRSSSGQCRPGEAILWTMPDMKPVRTLWGHTDAVRTVAFSPDGQYLATGGRSQRGVTRPGDVRLWHLPLLLA